MKISSLFRSYELCVMDPMDRNGPEFLNFQFFYFPSMGWGPQLADRGSVVGLEESRAQRAGNGDDAPCCHAVMRLPHTNTKTKSGLA